MNEIINKLKGDDLRSIGRLNDIISLIKDDQKKYDLLFLGIFSNDPVIRARSSDAIEKISKNYSHLLLKHKSKIIKNIDTFTQKELKWHIIMILSYMNYNGQEIEFISDKLIYWFNDKTEDNMIVKVNCLQALFDLAVRYPVLKKKLIRLLNENENNANSSIKARVKKLLKHFE